MNDLETGSPLPTPIMLRRARAADAAAAGPLLLATMGRLGVATFGGGDAERAATVLARLFAFEGNRFSHQFAFAAERAGSTVGLMVAYPAGWIRRLEWPLARQLVATVGWAGAARLLRDAVSLARVKEAEAGEYFVNSLAVVAECRGQGIGTRLLAEAQARARDAGFARCSLTVDVDNAGAQRLYERQGYRVVETLRVPALERRIGYTGMRRMVKDLAPGVA